MEDEEALQPAAVIRKTAELVHRRINELLPDRVMSPSILRAGKRISTCAEQKPNKRKTGLTVVRSILLSRKHSLWMEQRAIRARFHGVNDTRFQVDVQRARYILPRACLGEERRETAIARGRALSDTTIWLFTQIDQS